MKTSLGLIILFFLINGCTPKLWYHATKTGFDFEGDKRECLYEAEKYTGLSSYSSGPAYGLGGNIAAGIADGISQGMDEGRRRDRLFSMCMEQKGYYLK